MNPSLLSTYLVLLVQCTVLGHIVLKVWFSAHPPIPIALPQDPGLEILAQWAGSYGLMCPIFLFLEFLSYLSTTWENAVVFLEMPYGVLTGAGFCMKVEMEAG